MKKSRQETAKKLLEKGSEHKLISEVTGLSLEEIKALIKHS